MTKGIYALLLDVSKDIKVRVGSLGTLDFAKGYYVYVGSAQNNLDKRIARHCTKAKPRFWHADYLLGNRCANVVQVLVKSAGKTEECAIARRLQLIGTSRVGFGSSDCKCDGHLVKVRNLVSATRVLSDMKLYRLKDGLLDG